MMRRPSSKHCWFPALLLCGLMLPGCEVGHSWFSMNSDSPMPWFGFDLLPRRRTTQTLPRATKESAAAHSVANRKTGHDESRTGGTRTWSKELRLPPAPIFFDSADEEELSFVGPSGPFSR